MALGKGIITTPRGWPNDEARSIGRQFRTGPDLTLVIRALGSHICLFVALVLTCNSALAADASEDTIAIFQAVIDAARSVAHPSTGKGYALVQMNDPASRARRPPTGQDTSGVQTDLRTRHVSSVRMDFMFKGVLSRSTRTQMAEDGRPQPAVTWVVGDRCAICYNSSDAGWATVQRDPHLQFYRRIGYDFNPHTFMWHHATPLPELLEGILKGPATLSTRMDTDGILHLIAEYRSADKHEQTVISVDPARGYRLTGALSSMERLAQPDRTFTEFAEIQWADYGPSCYVERVNRSVYTGAHSWEDKESLPVDSLVQSTDVKVVEFQPNPEIDDSEFTLEGLHLPSGTEVIDQIAGVTYRIDGGLETDVLEKPLADAEFTGKIREQLDKRDESAGTRASDAQDTGEKEDSGELPPGGRFGIPAPIALIALGAVTLALLLSHRLSLSRKGRCEGE